MRHVDLLGIKREDGEAKASLRVVPKLWDGRHKISQGEFDIEHGNTSRCRSSRPTRRA
jgi:hypothetical protein